MVLPSSVVLQQLARGSGTSEVTALDVNTVVREVVETTQPVWHDHARREGRPVDVGLELMPLPQVVGRAAELREVLTNLLLNAVEAMPQGGQLTLRSWTEGEEVCVAVSDTGVGMTPEVQSKCGGARGCRDHSACLARSRQARRAASRREPGTHVAATDRRPCRRAA